MVQVVWDAAHQGTGSGRSGERVSVGGGAAFSSDDLLGLAAVTCLMSAFLTLAEERATWPLSYLSTADVVPADTKGQPPRVHIRTYITAPSDDARRTLEALVPLAQHQSPIACLLGPHLRVQTDFHVLTPGGTE